MSLADTVVVLRDGRVEDHGPPDRLYLRPATRFAATFMGDSNLLEATVVGTGPGGIEVDTELGRLVVPGTAADGAVVTVAIRPEHLHADGSGPVDLGRGTVVSRHFVGMHQRCRVQIGDREVTLHAPSRVPIEEGRQIGLSVDPSDVILLD